MTELINPRLTGQAGSYRYTHPTRGFWYIDYAPPWGWTYCHDNYDGAPDAGPQECYGTALSLRDAIEAIEFWIEEEAAA